MKATSVLLLTILALAAGANMADPGIEIGIANDLYTAVLEFIPGEVTLYNVEVNQWVAGDPLQGYFLPLTLAPLNSYNELFVELPTLPRSEGEYQFHLFFEPSGTEWVEELDYGVELRVGGSFSTESLTTPYYSTAVSAANLTLGGWVDIACREFFATQEGTEILRVFDLNFAVAVLPVGADFETLVQTHFAGDTAEKAGYFVELPLMEPAYAPSLEGK